MALFRSISSRSTALQRQISGRSPPPHTHTHTFYYKSRMPCCSFVLIWMNKWHHCCLVHLVSLLSIFLLICINECEQTPFLTFGWTFFRFNSLTWVFGLMVSLLHGLRLQLSLPIPIKPIVPAFISCFISFDSSGIPRFAVHQCIALLIGASRES